MICLKLNECILKHTVIKFLCYKSTKEILYKVFALSNATHRNTITEADYDITHINKKKLMPKSYKIRYHCQVLVDLNEHVNKSVIDQTNHHSGMVHEKHKGLTLGKQKITAVDFQKFVRCIISKTNCQVSLIFLAIVSEKIQLLSNPLKILLCHSLIGCRSFIQCLPQLTGNAP